jgi:hypothetical protein
VLIPKARRMALGTVRYGSLTSSDMVVMVLNPMKAKKMIAVADSRTETPLGRKGEWLERSQPPKMNAAPVMMKINDAPPPS